MKKAVIYARVSTDEQAEHGTSIPDQLETCRKYALEHNIKVVEEFTDDFTGTTLDRPGFNDLVDFLDTGGASIVIILTEDRLSRHFPNTVKIKTKWVDQGIELHFTDSGKVEYTLEGMIIGAFKDIMAHNEVEKIRERTTRGRDNKVIINKKPVLSGIPPYGYRKIGKNHEAELLINEVEARVVREVFRLYTEGNSTHKPMSLYKITNYLNEKGVPLPQKKRNSATKWTRPRIYRMLNNELYAGVYWWGKTRSVTKGFQQKGIRKTQPKKKWLRLDMPGLAIIDSHTFELAQKRAQRNRRLAKRNRKRQYLVTGFIRCVHCDSAVIGHSVHNGKSAYYRCGSEGKKYRDEETCDHVYRRISAQKIEMPIWGWVKNLLLDPEALSVGLDEIVVKQEASIESKQKKIETLTEAIDLEENKIQRLVAEFANNTDNFIIESVRKEIDQSNNRREALIADRKEVKTDLLNSEYTPEYEQEIMEMATLISQGIEQASYEEKRHILDLLDVKASLDFENERVDVSCGIPLFNSNIVLHPSRVSN